MPDDKYKKNGIGYDIGGGQADAPETAPVEEKTVELDLDTFGRTEEELVVDLGLYEDEVEKDVPERLAGLEARMAALEERLDTLAKLLESFISQTE